MSDIAIDDSHAPLILVVYPRQVTPDDYRTAMVRYRVLARQHARVGYVVDFRHFDPVHASPIVRRQAAEIFAENVAELSKTTACEARVVTSVTSRGVLTAFDWITPPKWPTENVATMDLGLAFVRRYLGPDVTLPPTA